MYDLSFDRVLHSD